MSGQITRLDDDSIIIGSSARFSCLSSGLVRMEYSPIGKFENRRSLRANNRPEPISFSRILEEKNKVFLFTPLIRIEYTNDGSPFHKDNICIYSMDGDEMIWRYGQIDSDNLGSVHLGMDCIQRRMIPEGVHNATSEYHENSTGYHLWSYVFGEGSVDSDAHYSGKMLSLEQLLAKKDLNKMPESLQKIIIERQKYPPGLLSRNGYFLYNDSQMAMLNPISNWIENRNNQNHMDLYFFFYGNDFQLALKNYKLLFGPTPLLPRYSLGLWYSRYPTFDEKGLKILIDDFDEHDLPLDVLVLDLEWHQRGWYGYDWDLEHINNPDEFLSYLKECKIHTTFNVHPDGIPVNDNSFVKFIDKSGIEINDSEYDEDDSVFKNFDFARKEHARAFMDVLLKPVQDQGMDFWWIDGDVQAKEIEVENQLWTNEVFKQHIEKNYKDRRSMIFSRTGGLGTHRYPFHFTGDTYSQWEVLKSQIEYTLKAGHIGQSYITHDIGGHMSDFQFADPELYLRWVQFGVMSPIFRLHSSGGGERRPWLYGENVLKSFKKALKWRMEMLPYLYTFARESNTKCLPICRSSFIMNPQWKEAYKIHDSYYLGDRIFCTPLSSPGGFRDIMLPKGKWFSALDGEMYESDGKENRTIIVSNHDLPPHYIKGGSILIKQPYNVRASQIPDKLIIEIYPTFENSHDHFTLYEDDGLTQDFEKGASSTTTFLYYERESEIGIHIGKGRGSFVSMAIKRDYEIRIYGDRKIKMTTRGLHKQNPKPPNYESYLIRDIPTNSEFMLKGLLIF